jgi:lysozyme family protein
LQAPSQVTARGTGAQRLVATRGSEAAFERWWKQIPRLEGTLYDWQSQSHNRHDRGGRTNFGITERAFMGCAGAAGLPKTPEAFENLTPTDAKKIAKAIWRTSGAQQISDPGVATVVGDWFWGSNTGAWRGVNSVLSSMGAAVGAGAPPGPGAKLGPEAMAALNSLPPERLVKELSEARAAEHVKIAERAPEQAVFLDGWQQRVALMLAQALDFDTAATADEPKLPSRLPWRA